MNIENAYRKALNFAKNHYENFPVVSFLIPYDLRKDIAIIYWFARTADNLADEGELSENERLRKLENFESRLSDLLKGKHVDDFDFALSETIKNRKLSIEHFYNLLKAFKQDVVKKRYHSFEEVLSYCKNSANPVGRLILELYDIRDQKAFEYSDLVCTALQLTNFYQDTKIDFDKGRNYFPQDEMEKFGVTEIMFLNKGNSPNLINHVKFNIERARKLFSYGKKLLNFLDGRLKLEIKWTILSGEAILDKIEKNNFDVLIERPKLNKMDFGRLLIKSLF